MPDSQDGNGRCIIDFEQDNVAGRAERDDQFAKEGIVVVGFPASEGKFLKNFRRLSQRAQRALGSCYVTIEQKLIEPQQVASRAAGIADTVCHWRLPARFAACSMPSSSA